MHASLKQVINLMTFILYVNSFIKKDIRRTQMNGGGTPAAAIVSGKLLSLRLK